MTKIEEKSLNAQLKLYSDIEIDNDMILHYTKEYAKKMCDNLMEIKIPMDKTDKENMEISIETFKLIREVLDTIGYDNLGRIKTIYPYIKSKNNKSEILHMLR